MYKENQTNQSHTQSISNSISNSETPKLPQQRRQSRPDQLIPRQPASDDKLKQTIRDMHLKVTEQRLLILKILHQGRMHVTAQEVYESVSKVDNSLGFATVYRFLRSMTEYGHVTEIKIGGMPARYELAPEGHHDHLTCTCCGKICEFENQEIENLQLQVAKSLGFKLTHHVLELYGICPECSQLAE